MPKGVYKHKPQSEETKRKRSLALMGNRNALGYKFTDEQKARARITNVNKNKLGEKSPSWKGGKYVDVNGYMRTKVGGLGRYKLDHHSIVEDFIKRPLKNKEIIHHINFDRMDNRIDNLYLFRTKAQHTKYHRFLRRHNLNGTNNQLTSNLYIYV